MHNNVELTEQQKEKVKKLERKSFFVAMSIGFKMVLFFMISTFFICLLDAFVVHSSTFRILSSLVSGLFIGYYTVNAVKEYFVQLSKEVEEIMR